MKKLLVAVTAALGLASAAVPASAGGSFTVSTGYYGAPSYAYGTYAPSHAYTVPSYSYVPQSYHLPYAPAPVVTYGYGTYGNGFYQPHRKYRRHGHHGHQGKRHYKRGHHAKW